MTSTTHPLVDDYLQRLRRAARVLPRHQADELIGEIQAHLDEGIGPDATEADVRNLLDDLGAPEAIVAEAAPHRPRPERGVREIVALVLLLTGFPLIIGWLVGAVLLLLSPSWTGRQKLLGLAVWPGGYFATVMAGSLMAIGTAEVSCGSEVTLTPEPSVTPTSILDGTGPAGDLDCGSSGSPILGIIVVAIFVIAPLIVTAYLYRAAGRRAADA